MNVDKTAPGTWRYAEKYGRFEGIGEVRADVQLPPGKLSLGSEDLEEVDDLEVELIGPDGSPVVLERPSGSFSELDRGTHNLFQIGKGVVEHPGVHTLRVRAPEAQQALLITVGEVFGVGDALKQMVPGRRLFQRLRGER